MYEWMKMIVLLSFLMMIDRLISMDGSSKHRLAALPLLLLLAWLGLKVR